VANGFQIRAGLQFGRPLIVHARLSVEGTRLIIDTHQHMLPDFFWRETENEGAPVGGLAPLQWSREAMIAFMDDARIDAAVLSVSTPGVHTGNGARARSLARRCNELAANLVQWKPDRLGSFACLPLPDVDASLEELAHAFDVLGLDGVVLFTNANGVYLGDPAMEPVLDDLERRRVVVFVHPNPSPDAAAHSLGLPDNLLDFPTDTNRVVAQMHYTNKFARTPNVKYIFAHAGGSIPYLAARFAAIDEIQFVPGADQRGTAADMFRRMYWDTAAAVSDSVFRMLRDIAGIDRVVYGTDFPYMRRDLAVDSKQQILHAAELSDADRRGVLGDNAARLFPRFQARRTEAATVSSSSLRSR
jgi:6-methylsalicylate decarboxylase